VYSKKYLSYITIVFLFQLVITSYILIGYLFKIKLSSFKWNISKKTFLYIILLFLIINIFDLIKSLLLNGKIITATGHNYIIWLFAATSFHMFYPALCEEVLWRGILISALRGMRIKNEYCNIIQAVLFGLAHIFMIGTNISWIFVLHTAVQMIWGYVYGKLYFKTKSLIPGIIFHALFDTRYFIV
jgi:membrane protease YdiL (CAAX protease family)